MARNRGVQGIVLPREVDMLLLIREEEIYAGRIRDSLVFTESKLQRLPAPLVSLDQARRDARRSLYMRPTSIAERKDEEEEVVRRTSSKSSCRSSIPHVAFSSGEESEISDSEGEVETVTMIGGATPFINSPIDKRPTVEDTDALYSERGSASRDRVGFTYRDLIETREGKKTTTVRALRRLANLWGKNAKLVKEQMLAALITEYARRYPKEVDEYEKRRSSTRIVKPRRRNNNWKRR